MKKYEKPTLTVLSLTGNEQLCGSCSDDGASILLNNDKSGMAEALSQLVGDYEGPLTRDELAGVFGTGETGCGHPVDMYCKFTGALTVAWS